MSTISPSQQQIRAAAGTRRYRSKTQRPCDLCRARKVLCNIPDPSQPCQLCERTGRRCTFVGNPNKKQKDRGEAGRVPNSTTPMVVFDDMPRDSPDLPQPMESQPTEQNVHNHIRGVMNDGIQSSNMNPDMDIPPLESMVEDTMWTCEEGQNWDIPVNHTEPSFHMNLNSTFNILQHEDLCDLELLDNQEPATGDQNSNTADQSISASPTGIQGNTECASLDQKTDYSTQLIGYSNESDPFLLQHFPYNASDEVDFFKVTYRRPATSSSPPIHFLQSRIETATQARDLVDQCMSTKDDRDQLEKLVNLEMGVILLRLYFQFVFEALPVLSRSLFYRDERGFVEGASVGLLAAIYAIALPFTAWDEQLCLDNAYSKPSPVILWQISYASLQKEIQFPRLSTIQIYTLLLNHTPFDQVSVESPFMWTLAGSMLAMSQSLGLNLDPSGWKLPPWEIRLRRRLWWSVVVEHSWRAITHGRSSLLCDDDWNVAPLTKDDFAVDAALGSANGLNQQISEYYIRLCSLTEIANGICRQFFTVRAVSQSQPFEALVEKARLPRQQLLQWIETLPESLRIPNESDQDAKEDAVQIAGSLHVAYYTAHILVLRALLRPIISTTTKLDHLQPSVGMVLQASRGLMQTIFKLIRGLDVRYQSAFWPAFTRHCLAYPGLFSYMLCLQQREPQMTLHDQNLLVTWRRTLRTRVQSWPLLRFAIVKVDALFWKKVNQLSADRSTGSK